MIKTHSDAQKMIIDACCGAPVEFTAIVGGAGENTESMRRYIIGDASMHEQTACSIYALPFDPAPVLKSIRQTLAFLYNSRD